MLSTAPLLETSFPDSDAPPPRQGPRRLRARRRPPAHRRDGSHLRVRLRARLRHSRQGQGADAAVGVLVRAHGRSRAAPPDAARRRRRIRPTPQPHARRAARPHDAVRARTEPIPIECVARGYLSGSGWKEYQQTGSVCGVTLPAGLRESERLPEPIFTPATKAETRPRRQHQRGRSGADRRRRADRAAEGAHARDLPPRRAHAESKGIIIADTKFEFGLVGDGATRPRDIVLIDEVLTPDSSRFWPRGQYEPGGGAAELRQAVRARLPRRDPLEQAAAGAVAARRRSSARTREKYVEAFRLLSGPRAAVGRCGISWRSSSRKCSTRASLYDDARREFEKMFIARRAAAHEGQPRRRRRTARAAPQHHRPQDRRIPNQDEAA